MIGVAYLTFRSCLYGLPSQPAADTTSITGTAAGTTSEHGLPVDVLGVYVLLPDAL